MRRKRTAKEQEAHEVRGKGWSVLSSHQRTPNHVPRYVAAVVWPGGKRKSCGARDTKEEAAVLAVAAARQYGTLNWKQTVKWFQIMGYKLDGSDTLTYTYTRGREKGWYVRKDVTEAGTVRYVAMIGFADSCRKRQHEHNLRFVCSRMSRRMAAEHAIKAAKGTDRYDEAATVLWLQRNNMNDLIPVAKEVA